MNSLLCFACAHSSYFNCLYFNPWLLSLLPFCFLPLLCWEWKSEWSCGATELSSELPAEVESQPWIIINKGMPKVNRCRAVKQILWRATLLASESHPIPQQKQKQTSIALFNSGTFWLPQITPCGNYSGAVGLPALGQLSQLLAVLLSFQSALFGNTLFPLPNQLQLMVSSLSTQFGLIPNSQLGFYDWQQKGHATGPSCSWHHLWTRLSCLGLCNLAKPVGEGLGSESQISVFS